MKKVIKFVKGRRDDRKEGGITPSQSGELLSPAQTPEDERFLGLDSAAGYYVDFCGKDKSLTKLHKAAWQGNIEKVKSALKKVDIDVVDRHNRTPLHFAVVQGHPNIVWFLLGNNARHTICDAEGRTPLLKAVECGHKECMNLLLERGANINHADFSGNTSLHIAVKQGVVDTSTILLDKGADLSIANNEGEYPLHLAIKRQFKEMVELLLRYEAPVNAVDRENRTPLMLAAKSGNLVLAQLFFEYGAHLFVTDSNGWTAEDYALLGGHQNVASELKQLMKKESKPSLETHTEEDENEVAKSDDETWKDSNSSDKPEQKKMNVGQFMKKLSTCSDKAERDEELTESPGSGIVPPPCQPPRSWEIIEAGMIDEAGAAGSEPKRRSITALGSLHSRRESFTDNSNSHSDGNKYTLSLNRRKDPKKKNAADAKHRFSFNEEDSLKSSLSGDFSLFADEGKDDVQLMMRFKRKEKEKQKRSSSGSDWDSNLSSLLENSSAKDAVVATNTDVGEKSDILGQKQNLEVAGGWVGNSQLGSPRPTLTDSSNILEEEAEQLSSSWDSKSAQEPAFPPPPTAFELGVDMAKSISYMKGISIDHAPGSDAERDVWAGSKDSQTKSLELAEERKSSDVEGKSFSNAKHQHSRNPSISNQKWKSVELPGEQRPANRLVEVHRRINDQLECYDQALRELAETSYAKRQDAIISTLTANKTSKIENYYSLPSSKFKTDKEFSLTGKTKVDRKGYTMSLPLQFGKRPTAYCQPSNNFMDESNGPMSLPFAVNNAPIPLKVEEVENNERLGFEEENVSQAKASVPNSLTFVSPDQLEVDNLESPISDEQNGSDRSEKRNKRHMLLAMRDVKHAVQVTNSFKTSLDDQILSPLTKTEGEFNLSPRKLLSLPLGTGVSTSEEPAFFRGDSEGGIGRQETVIERLNYKSSPSESGDEPTLWLQDKNVKDGDESSNASSDEKQDKKENVKRGMSPGNSKRTPSAALRRIQRLDSSSENEECANERDKKNLEDGSPEVSLSSGPIEPLGRDSGSDPDSSHRDASPIHQYSLKKHHKWLKEQLQTENKERQNLEQVAAQLAEKAERLQYELADAKEATKSRDEIIVLLQGQLTRMEAAYTKSLEESVHCRLQLTTLEQEILHLKELCTQYEEERDVRTTDNADKQTSLLIAKIRQLEEEREGLSRVVVRLEQENRSLEQSAKERLINPLENDETCQLKNGNELVTRQFLDNSLKRRNNELENQISLANEINLQLESKLNKLLNSFQFSGNEEINQSILTLSKKNSDMEKQLKILVEDLNAKRNSVCQHENLNADNETLEILKKDNSVLNQTIANLQEEIHRLKKRPNDDEASITQIKDVVNEPNEKVEDSLISNKDEEIFSLRSQVASLQKALQDLQEGRKSTEDDGIRQRSDFPHARAVRQDELAWSHLYGIKSARRQQKISINSIQPNKPPELPFDKDSEEFIELKVKELEQELERAKEEIARQRLESHLRIKALMPPLMQNGEMLNLKKKVTDLEGKAVEADCRRQILEARNAEMAMNLKEKRQLELELQNVKCRMQSEYVPKVEKDAALFQMELSARQKTLNPCSQRLDDNLKRKLETLARERERADALRRRLGRQCISWETGVGMTAAPLSTFRSLPRDRPLDSPTKVTPLDSETRAKLNNTLDSSIKQCPLGSPEEQSDCTKLDSSYIKLELLKKKYLC